MKQNKVEEVQEYLAARDIIVSETAIVNAAIKIATRFGGNAVFVCEFKKVKKMKNKKATETYNKTHPELREGEMFLTNCVLQDYIPFGWNTKRRGEQAYTIMGVPISGYKPVFVQRSEYEEGMKDEKRI